MLDRLLQMDANTLFCGRSELTFQYKIEQGTVTSSVTTLDQSPSPQVTLVKPRQTIGVGLHFLEMETHFSRRVL